MGIRLIREQSDTPNITNMDDVRMARYAYGGYNGFVQGKGMELESKGNGDTLTINSGVIVLQGWEVEIDSNGWSMRVSANNTTKLYYTVYCEVNLSLGAAASIKSTYDENKYPTIDAGDDLTRTPNGIARIELCRFTAQSGLVSDVEKAIKEIPYVSNELAIINKRLEEEGFKEASVQNGEVVLYNDWADAGIAEDYWFENAENYPSVNFVKLGRLFAFQGLRIATKTQYEYEYATSLVKINTVIGKINKLFAPPKDIERSIKGILFKKGNLNINTVKNISGTLTISKDGEMSVRGEVNEIYNISFYDSIMLWYGGLDKELKGDYDLPVWLKNRESS